MRRTICITLVIAIAFTLTGCDALQRKFTRKKKAAKKPRIYQLKKYDIKPSLELYEKHLAYWQTWSSELIQRLGDNGKKDKRCIEELIGQIGDMQNLLVDEKAEELQAHMETYEKIRDVITREDLTQYNKDRTRMSLEREDRNIKRLFSADRMRNYIRKDFARSEEEDEVPEEGESYEATTAIMLPAQEMGPTGATGSVGRYGK